ncbi:MAG: CvpA family protein [Verrucomicrobia bacterium]|nr:CvpA family protein [Verrucomicrobiota bacterium]MCF7709530.1 CvpA family protein [Verrucomicrobiota bacterium]
MDFQGLGWFDLIVAGLLVIGMLRGRNRGISMEILPAFQWIAIIVFAVLFYPSTAELLSNISSLSLLKANVIVYLAIVALIKFLFSTLRQGFGAKITESDLFGHWEYKLGIVAGIFRFVCIIIFACSLLNAKLVTDEEYARQRAAQEENFGDIKFPTLGGTQRFVFDKSLSGRLIKKHLSFFLIEETKAGE